MLLDKNDDDDLHVLLNVGSPYKYYMENRGTTNKRDRTSGFDGGSGAAVPSLIDLFTALPLS